MIGLVIVAFSLPPVMQSFAQHKNLAVERSHASQKSSALPYPATLLNINNFSMWIRADGQSGVNPFTGAADIIYPRGTATVESGVYFVHLRAWLFEKTQKILVRR